MFRRLIAMCSSLVLAGGIVGAAWRLTASSPPLAEAPVELPLPPFPPRITQDNAYETCLDALTGDPAGAVVLAQTWQADGGGDSATHCRALALIALGKPASGADLLEQLARQIATPSMTQASLLSQAVQARLMVAQDDRSAASQAVEDASQALGLSPLDTQLFIMRATAEGILGRLKEAVGDLNQALHLDAARPDALVLRAVMRRQLNELDLAQADVSKALAQDPDDADALLERGILRQRMGDPVGARLDWEHAREADPNSTTADLAQQNLSLLEAGPGRNR